jgi:murein DD-endopeptidase MepM/ murein hydrolase activator NlpD
MMGVFRAAAIFGVAGLVWAAGASQIPSHMRLSLASVVVGAVVTQPFGCTYLELEPYAPYCPGRHVHTGIDLAAKSGTPVYSATGGVVRVGFDPDGAGNFVVVSVDAHARVIYCHLSAVGAVNGQTVSAGQVIGALGSTGRSTGPHLHFEVQVDGRAIDPVPWLAS